MLRAGSFDSIRLLAALMVFHGHSFALAGRPEPWLAGTTFGGAAVMVFFVVSGYWVAQSALNRTIASYAVARAIRIFPGLAICVGVTVVICALGSTLPLTEYFSRPQTYRFLQNAFVFWTPMVGEISTVFQNGANHAPNGSLWTLRYEVLCYVALACVTPFGMRALEGTIIAAGVFAAVVLFGSEQGRSFILLDHFEYRWTAMLGGAFFLGAALTSASKGTLKTLVITFAFLMVLGRNDPTLAPMFATVLYGTGALWVGLSLNLDRVITRGRDLSYGIYIYAFPCQQLAVRAFHAETSDAAFLAAYISALVATISLAGLSWFLVEKPALDKKTGVVRWIEGRRSGGRLKAAPTVTG